MWDSGVNPVGNLSFSYTALANPAALIPAVRTNVFSISMLAFSGILKIAKSAAVA